MTIYICRMINTISKFNFLITIIFLNSSMLMAQKYETQEYQVIDQIDNAEISFILVLQ